jgi:hypothetical protein
MGQSTIHWRTHIFQDENHQPVAMLPEINILTSQLPKVTKGFTIIHGFY